MATVDHENDQVMLLHGVVCPYSHGKYLDSEDGYTTWDVSPSQRCEDIEFEVIYEERVNKTRNIRICSSLEGRTRHKYAGTMDIQLIIQEYLSWNQQLSNRPSREGL